MEKTNNIVCPFCQKEFQLATAITNQIENELKGGFQKQLENQKKEIEDKMSQEYEKLLAQENLKLREFDAELKKKQEEIEALYEKEKDILQKEKLFEERKRELEKQLENQKKEIENKMSQEYEELLAQERQKLREAATQKAKREFDIELKEKQEEIEEAYKKIETLREKEKDVLQKEKLLEESKREFEKQLENQKKEIENKVSQEYEELLAQERQKLREAATQKAKREFDVELKEKQEEIEEAYKKIEALREKEKEVKQKERLLEESKHDLEIKFEERLTNEIRIAYADAHEKLNLEFDLKIKEKEKIIEDLNKQMKEGQRKAEQGSVKLQGEILELELEELLKMYFPDDEILPVASGERGGDIIHRVKLPTGKLAGTILWETKRTKNWYSTWIQKLKDDQRDIKAEIAVIASEVIPSDIKNFGIQNEIWITELRFALGLASVLRENLKSIALMRIANSGKDDKAEMLFNYLTGTQFKQRVESILESYAEMSDDIIKEKKFMEKSWAKKEKQVERFIKNISGMCGDLQGIGANLPEMKLLDIVE